MSNVNTSQSWLTSIGNGGVTDDSACLRLRTRNECERINIRDANSQRSFNDGSTVGKYGILHNDIQAENVLADSIGHVYLIDFGMARRLDPKKKRELFDWGEKRGFSLLLNYYSVL